ncbi:uncharacterized protein [Diadema antillarum]|uniref:uncharacterized protein n=1 Tax=Diadema antillarum TaxID=105358 RepID=UPI003A8A5932
MEASSESSGGKEASGDASADEKKPSKTAAVVKDEKKGGSSDEATKSAADKASCGKDQAAEATAEDAVGPGNETPPSSGAAQAPASSVGVISASPNVVVERVGAGLLTWNLTATGGDPEGEVMPFPFPSPAIQPSNCAYEDEASAAMSYWGKEAPSSSTFDFIGSSTILTEDQILKIDAALKSEQDKMAANPLITPQDSLEQMETEESSPLDDAQETEAEEKLQLNASNDSLNFDNMLDIGATSLNTKDLMNEVMSSELLLDAIGDEGLVAAATVVSTTSDGETESGSTSDTTPSKKREDSLKRRSARIAKITANDLTLRQAIRKKEQQKKEREQKKKQKEEEKKSKKVAEAQESDKKEVHDASGDLPETSKSGTAKEELKGVSKDEEQPAVVKPEIDLTSEIAKYLSVIDQEIKKSEEEKLLSGQVEESVKVEDAPQDSKEGKEASHSKVSDDTKLGAEAEKGTSNKEVKKEDEAEEGAEQVELKEEEEEEKEVGELSDQEGDHKESSVYWMDHSYAANTPKVIPPHPAQDTAATREPSRRSARRENKKKKEEEAAAAESKLEEKADDKSQASSKNKQTDQQEKEGKKEEEEEEEGKSTKKTRKHHHKGKHSPSSGAGRKGKDRSRSKSSKERGSSKDKEKERGDKEGERRSRRSRKDKEKKDKGKEKEKVKEKEKGRDNSEGRRSSRRSRDAKKKHLDEAELSDIPFSSEEDDERDAGEHDSGSEWTSDDDPEKLWCICKQPHDGKFMICCDKCEDWFHGKCVNISKKEGKRMEQEDLSWVCPNCKEAAKTGPDQEAKMKEETKKKQEAEVPKEETPKDKEKTKSQEEKKKKKEKGEVESEKEKEKGQKEAEEKKREKVGSKRKSDASAKKGAEGEEEEEEEEGPAPSKKKRLKFFRPPPPKQHCIGTGCDNWARSGSVYCSPGCIVKHAKESMKLLNAERERAMGIKGRRDSTGASSVSSVSTKPREDDRISVIERHTGRLRTGLTAPTYGELPYWLGRHPTYEVLRPNIKHGYSTSAFYSGKGSAKHKPDGRRTSLDSDRSRTSSASDSEKKVSTKQITSPIKEGATPSSESLEKRQKERREKVRQLLEMKRREEELAQERERDRQRIEEMRRRREEEKKEEEEQRRKEEERRRKEDKERREREKREREERARLQAESSKLAEQTSESVRVNVKRTLLEVLLTRVKKAPDVKGVTADEVKKVAKQIEFELYKLFNDTGAKYKAKYRTLIFNIKDTKNLGLFRHILKGEISPRNLVRMSSDQLASKELMKWREQEAKNELDMIVQTEKEKKSMPMTFVKKTHKGEVELGEETLGDLVPHVEIDAEAAKHEKSPPLGELRSPTRATPTTPTTPTGLHSADPTSPTTPTSPPTPTTMLLDTTDQHKAHLFDLNCKICTGKIPAPREEKASKKKAIVRNTPKLTSRVSEEFDEEPPHTGEKPVKFFGEDADEKKYRPKSVNEELYDDLMETVSGAAEGVDDDDDDDDDENTVIIRAPKDEARTPPGSPTPTVRTLPKPGREKPARPAQLKRSSSSAATPSTPAWRGFIFMHEVAKFVAVAHHVSGPAHSIPLDLQDTLEVCGRIPYPVVWDYFSKLKQSQSTEMTIMRFHVWQGDEEEAYFSLFDYFYTRQRIGVIGKNRSHVKDFYLLALPSTDKVPSHILPFHGPGLPPSRPHLLLGIVVRHKDKPPRSLSLDEESVTKPSGRQQQEPPTQHIPQKKPQPVREIQPPANTLSSFSMALPNIREISDIIKDKEPQVPLRTKEVYVPETQLVDPIVAQYANADPKQLEVELEEPYSPTIEEREAPYDPSDPADDWSAGRSMPPSAVIPEPAEPPATTAATIPGLEVTISKDEPAQSSVTNTAEPQKSDVRPSDIASVAADASQNLLSAFSEQTGLSEQQQLLIQLTKQVEEAKKALLDRQIESLQSEINKAAGKKSDAEESADDAGTSPDVRLAPADSSTMTPKDDSSSGLVSAPSAEGQEVPKGSVSTPQAPPLLPPPELPQFAVDAMMWKMGQTRMQETKDKQDVVPENIPQSQADHPLVARPEVTGSSQMELQGTWDAGARSQYQPHHEVPPQEQQHQHPTHHWPQPQPGSHDPSHRPELPHQPPGAPLHPDPSQSFMFPGHKGHPQDIAKHHAPHPEGPLRHPFHPPVPAGPQVPAVPVTKKRKLEPPPPGVEGWKYDDDHSEPSKKDRPSSAPQNQPREPDKDRQHPFNPRDEWEMGRDFDARTDYDHRQDRFHGGDVDDRRHWGRQERHEEQWGRGEPMGHDSRDEREPWGRDEARQDPRRRRDPEGWGPYDPRRDFEEYPRDERRQGGGMFPHRKRRGGMRDPRGDPRGRPRDVPPPHRRGKDFDYRGGAEW